MVVGVALPRPAIFSFDGATNLLDTASGPIEVSKETETVAGQTVLDGAASAANGIVHAVDGVFQNEWRGITLKERMASATPLMYEVVFSSGLDQELESLTRFGTTFASVADEALQDESAKEEGNNMLL